MESDAGFWQLFADTFIGYIPSLSTLKITITGLALSVPVVIYTVVSGEDGLKNFLWLRDVAGESRYSQRYRDVITSGLAWLEHPKRMSRLFSYRAFSVCLALALVYPMLFWLIAWVAGGSGDFAGTITLSPAGVEEISMGERLFVLGMLIVLAVFYYYCLKNARQFEKFLSSHLERMLHGKLPENMVRAFVAFLAFLAVVVLGTFVMLGAFVAISAVVVDGVHVAASRFGAVVTVIAVVGVVTGGALVMSTVFIAVDTFVTGVRMFLEEFRELREFREFHEFREHVAFVAASEIGTINAMVVIGVFVVISTFVAGVAGVVVGASAAIFWLTFYTLLPVVNAFFDWLSIGASRLLIRLLLNRHSVWLVALLVGVDLALALLFMGIISLSIPFLLGAINSGLSTLENPVAIPWQATVEAARTAPWTAGLMATAMIVTTLIPTAVHLFTALVSLAPINLSHTKLAKTSDEAAEAPAALKRTWITLQSLTIPTLFSWGILWLASITLLSLFEAAYQGSLGDLLIDGALASGTFAEGLF